MDTTVSDIINWSQMAEEVGITAGTVSGTRSNGVGAIVSVKTMEQVWEKRDAIRVWMGQGHQCQLMLFGGGQIRLARLEMDDVRQLAVRLLRDVEIQFGIDFQWLRPGFEESLYCAGVEGKCGQEMFELLYRGLAVVDAKRGDCEYCPPEMRDRFCDRTLCPWWRLLFRGVEKDVSKWIQEFPGRKAETDEDKKREGTLFAAKASVATLLVMERIVNEGAGSEAHQIGTLGRLSMFVGI
ncbi:hypothetical protein MAJ_11507, partial [Metarhizium majus ARSEF 297]